MAKCSPSPGCGPKVLSDPLSVQVLKGKPRRLNLSLPMCQALQYLFAARFGTLPKLCWDCFPSPHAPTACGILIPQPGVEPMPLAVKAQSPNCGTAGEFPPPSSMHHHLTGVFVSKQPIEAVITGDQN